MGVTATSMLSIGGAGRSKRRRSLGAAECEGSGDAAWSTVEGVGLAAVVHALRFRPLLPLLVLVDQPQDLIFLYFLILLRRTFVREDLRMVLLLRAFVGESFSLVWLGL